jgi:hypothetical protein
MFREREREREREKEEGGRDARSIGITWLCSSRMREVSKITCELKSFIFIAILSNIP